MKFRQQIRFGPQIKRVSSLQRSERNMSVIPPHPWYLAYNSGGGGAASPHVITVASALRLGHLLRLHCSNHLHRLLLLYSPLRRDGCYLDKSPGIKDLWCQGSCSLTRHSFLKTLADTFSAPCSSCFSFFGGKESENNYASKGHFHVRTSGGNSFDGRLWTNVILALNVLVYVAQIATKGRLIMWGAKVNSLIDRGQLWRLATSSFLHANIGHLMINSYSLNSIGPAVEQLTGPRRFLAVYFTSAIASSMMSYRFCQSPAVGASGAIFGLVGAFAVFILRHRRLFGGGKQDIQHIVRMIALNMAIGLLSKGIDNWGHLGGLLGGAAMSWFVGPAWKYEFQSDDGRRVFADRAPIFHFIPKRRLH